MPYVGSLIGDVRHPIARFRLLYDVARATPRGINSSRPLFRLSIHTSAPRPPFPLNTEPGIGVSMTQERESGMTLPPTSITQMQQSPPPPPLPSFHRVSTYHVCSIGTTGLSPNAGQGHLVAA
ncbi:hypothetical protein LZ31DRAFT_264146 [Colletotrichum somersetense]|nr:hypothetical protein LZ31DRAFT_264146 [Colletotrichum somersetense]